MTAAAYVRLTRPPNSLMMFFAVVVGAVASNISSLSADKLLLALATAYGLTGSSMILNDYFDREVDAVNNPSRPIPSGAVSPSSALVFSFITAGVGLTAAALTNFPCLLLATASYIVATAYNWRLKKTGLVGNMAVSFTVVAPFLYGSVIVGQTFGRVAWFAMLAFLANTGREVVKGMSDVAGDAKRDVRTVARVYGLDKAAYLGSGLYMAAVALSPLPYFLGLVNFAYMVVVAVADAGFVYSSIKLVLKPTAEQGRRQKNLTLLWMFIALIAFLAGSL
ncbi:MAG: geranylgeranylglycerol-phosphate geranylgeranyltransferase [Candidatus Caldarchaeum sp.]|nr:geranylgeranylglycerol-phosphate geranylgeranyltransferase [Candidatus Caldarchaeum sp.]